MKHLLLQAGLLLATTLVAVGCVKAHPPLSVAKQAKEAVVSLQIDSGGELMSFCTAVAVGPHTIWTAKHCIDGSVGYQVFLDGGYCPTNKVVADDGIDGVLVNTPCDTWKYYAPMAKSLPEITENVFVFGNVRGLPEIYRVGYVMGQMELPTDVALSWPLPEGLKILAYDMNTGPGDSGAGVFNYRGEVVCSHSFGFGLKGFSLGGCFVPSFTEEQLKEIK